MRVKLYITLERLSVDQFLCIVILFALLFYYYSYVLLQGLTILRCHAGCNRGFDCFLQSDI